jgi:hypothetical protein
MDDHLVDRDRLDEDDGRLDPSTSSAIYVEQDVAGCTSKRRLFCGFLDRASRTTVPHLHTYAVWKHCWCVLDIDEGTLSVDVGRSRLKQIGRSLVPMNSMDPTNLKVLARLGECRFELTNEFNRNCIRISFGPEPHLSRSRSINSSAMAGQSAHQFEYFSSHSSTLDLKWWLQTLQTVQKDLIIGRTPVLPPSVKADSAEDPADFSLHAKSLSWNESQREHSNLASSAEDSAFEAKGTPLATRTTSLANSSGNVSKVSSSPEGVDEAKGVKGQCMDKPANIVGASPVPASSPGTSSGAHRPAERFSIEPHFTRLEEITVYSTNHPGRMYHFVGNDKYKTRVHVISADCSVPFAKTRGLGDILHVHETVYEYRHFHKNMQQILEQKTMSVPLGGDDDTSPSASASGGGKIFNRSTMSVNGTKSLRDERRDRTPKLVLTACGIVGFVRFVKGYYAIFITQRKEQANFNGNPVFGIDATEMLALFEDKAAVDVPPKGESSAHSRSASSSFLGNGLFGQLWSSIQRKVNPSQEDMAESRYLGYFNFVDIAKDFFFSYTYDLTHSLQDNMTIAKTSPPAPCDDRFMWNHFLSSEFDDVLSTADNSGSFSPNWIIPIIHGCCRQQVCSIFGRLISIALIARRSRFFAGTRYLKRGVSDKGEVANDVEIEQIVWDSNHPQGGCSGFLQHRGSIPVFWYQEASFSIPKPPIEMHRVDPSYTASRHHFADLFSRYSAPVLVLNLVKQAEKRDREIKVGKEFENSVDYINNFLPASLQIQYVALDFSRISKQKNLDVLAALDEIADWAVQNTGFFVSHPKLLYLER